MRCVQTLQSAFPLGRLSEKRTLRRRWLRIWKDLDMIQQVLDWIWDIQGLTCREATRLSASAMDRPLTIRERGKLLIHRLLCSYCRTYMRQLRLLRKWTRRMGDLDVPAGATEMPSASASRIKKRLRSEIPQAK